VSTSMHAWMALHGVVSNTGVIQRFPSTSNTRPAALKCCYPQFKVCGCLQWLANSSPTGVWASTRIGIPSHALTGTQAPTHKYPPPYTQTFAHPLPMLQGI
jgi:hypothetical protein